MCSHIVSPILRFHICSYIFHIYDSMAHLCAMERYYDELGVLCAYAVIVERSFIALQFHNGINL